VPAPDSTRSSPGREPLEVAELRQLQQAHPELSDAAELQIRLFELQHRLQARLPHPTLDFADSTRRQALVTGCPVLSVDDLGIDWPELRLMAQRVAGVLQQFDALDAADAAATLDLSRDGDAFERVVREWYDRTGARPSDGSRHPSDAAGAAESLSQVLLLSMRPFLGRCAETAAAMLDTSTWSKGYCPLCGGEPEMAVITRAATRRLVCGRCLCQWDFDALACPHCRNADRTRITTFASRDRLYRIAACDECQRYLKAYDARHSERPFLPGLDSVATLPLDAAAIQRGYLS